MHYLTFTGKNATNVHTAFIKLFSDVSSQFHKGQICFLTFLVILYSFPCYLCFQTLQFFPSDLPFSSVLLFYILNYHSLLLYNFWHYSNTGAWFLLSVSTVLFLAFHLVSFSSSDIEVKCTHKSTSPCYSSGIATIICGVKRPHLTSAEDYIPL